MIRSAITAAATVAGALLFAAAPALAGPAADMAKAHFNAIAAADVPAITSQYGDDAHLHWIGGPLNGDYDGVSTITPVWAKFAGNQGKLTVEVKNLQEAANNAGATVTADVTFNGKAAIPLRYVLLYRGGKLVDEVWQIAPPANYK